MSKSAQSAFTLVETLVASAVLMIFFAAIATILQISLETVGESRVKTVAATLAQQRLELARNLPYLDVGTQGGIPPGSLLQSETINLNGQNFHIYTTVVYIDDPFDGSAPVDVIPADYKRVKVAVDWDGVFAPRVPLVLWSDVAPRGLETIKDAGTLSVLVFDSAGNPVPNAQVHIQASTVIPPVDLNTLTDDTGRVLLPGAPECIECYKISATKEGFTTDRTYGSEEVTNPYKPHISILEAQVSNISFAIDQMAAINFRVWYKNGETYQARAQFPFRLYGTKEIGRDDQDEPVLLYDETIVSGYLGNISVSNLVWDTYRIELISTSAYDFAGSWAFSPAQALPGITNTMEFVIVDNTPHSLLVKILGDNGLPVETGEVELRDDLNSFIATKSVGLLDKPDRGQVMFTDLQSNLYGLTIRSTSYQEATASVSVVGAAVEQFILDQEGE